MSGAWIVPPIFVGGVDAAAGLLKRYASTANGELHSGPRFESFAPTADADVIGCQDLVAVTMLGVSLPARSALRLLEVDAARISELLAAIPQDVDLADAPPELLDRPGASRQLWDLLDAAHGQGAAVTSRLMARKRPRLVPVQAGVVQSAVGYRPGQDFWVELQALLVDDRRRLLARLHQVRSAAGLDAEFSDIRVFDIVVWMAARERAGGAPVTAGSDSGPGGKHAFSVGMSVPGSRGPG